MSPATAPLPCTEAGENEAYLNRQIITYLGN
jgi:hypothetical protein